MIISVSFEVCYRYYTLYGVLRVFSALTGAYNWEETFSIADKSIWHQKIYGQTQRIDVARLWDS